MSAASREFELAERILAKHQLAYVLPGGVVCTCGEELSALNPPLDDGSVKGEPLALAVHQLHEMKHRVHDWDDWQHNDYLGTHTHSFRLCNTCGECEVLLGEGTQP